MKSFFKTFFAALLAILVFCFIIAFVLIGSMSISPDNENVSIDEQSILHLSFDNEIIDRQYDNRFNLDFQTFEPIRKDGLNSILKQIQKAKVDSRIEGIFIDTKSPMAGLASLQEIRDAIVDFKSSGKWVLAYSDQFSQSAYYLASTADELYIQPEGLLDFKGLRSDVTFLKGLLDKIGVDVQVIRPKNNRFKSAVEPFLLDSMSTANEEQLTRILQSIWNHMATDIAASRGMSVDQLNNAVNELKCRNSKSAKEAMLVSDALYRDQVIDLLKEKTGVDADEDLSFVSLSEYARSSVSEFTDHERIYEKDKVAVIYASGAIDMGDGSEETIGSDGLADQVSIARKDSTIKAIVLRVNSPGGSALASDVIWREMTLAKETKPVIVSMGDVAASGGYYISCNADKVFASEMTITGSIGVFGMIPNTQKLNEDILGVHHDGVQTHKFGDLMDINRPLRNEEAEVWQDMVDHIYDDFTGKVASGRSMSQSFVDSIGQGRVWSGVDALGNGLIDAYGGLNEAIAEAAARAELESYKVKNLPVEQDPIEALLQDLTGQAKVDGIKQLAGKDIQLYNMVKQYQEVMNMKGIQTRMPFILDIH